MVMNERPRKLLKMADGSGIDARSSNGEKEKIVFNKYLQDFMSVTETSGFVDKSLFVKAFLEYDSSVILITAPRRFCKSTNMDMLRQFLQGECKTFVDNDLKLYQEHKEFFEKHCTPHPVIHVDFKDIEVDSYSRFLRSMGYILRQTFKTHKYLVKQDGENVNGYVWSSEKLQQEIPDDVVTFLKYFQRVSSQNLNESDINEGLSSLCEWLSIYYSEKASLDKPGKIVYLLIDEYDAPVQRLINNKFVSDNDAERILHCLRDTMSRLLKANIYLKKGLINACVRLAGVLSGYADSGIVDHCAFLCNKDFVKFYGFTAYEIKELLKKPEFHALKDSLDTISEWYNGYDTVDDDVKIYNNFSVLSFIRKTLRGEEPCPNVYWIDTGYVKNLAKLFAFPAIRCVIEAIIGGQNIMITSVESMTIEMVLDLKSLIGLSLKDPEIEQVSLFLQFLADTGHFNVMPFRAAQSTEGAKEIISVEYLMGDGEEVELEVTDSQENKISKSVIKIPNKEMKNDLSRKCYNVGIFKQVYKLTSPRVTAYLTAITMLITAVSRDAFCQLRDAVANLFKHPATPPENEDTLHCILYTLAYLKKKSISRTKVNVLKEKPSRGRPKRLDILIYDKNVAILIELKVNSSSAVEAYKQIFAYQYDKIPECYNYDVEKKIFIGLHMDKEGVVTLCYSTKNGNEKIEMETV